MKSMTIALILNIISQFAAADDARSVFSDQAHYELVYAYKYQSNLVERMIFECTADGDVWATFAYATAPIWNSYTRHVMGTSVFQRDPFTNQLLISLLWQESVLNLTRSTEVRGDPAEPTLMAQRDVLHLVQRYSDDLDALCDFIFWEEVAVLEDIFRNLLLDTEVRLPAEKYAAFREDAEDGLPILRKLFLANPLRSVEQ